jgi:hypothetical protein
VPASNICTLLVLAMSTVPLHAQWLGYPTPGIPHTRDGKPNLSAATPRGPDGKPVLSGLWENEPAPAALRAQLIPEATNAAGEEPLSQYFINIFSDFKPGDEPLQPAAAAALRARGRLQPDLAHLALPARGHAARGNGSRPIQNHPESRHHCHAL